MQTFDPVDYSAEELTFLKGALGKSPNVAFADGIPEGVVASQVRPILQYVRDMEDLGRPWAGVGAVVEAIEKWEEIQAEVKAMRRMGSPRWPSMYSYDSKGRPHRGGPGADSSKVITYFDADGNRTKIAVQLEGPETGNWTAPWGKEAREVPTELIEIPAAKGSDKAQIQCAVCNHVEQYSADSEGSKRAARARMSKHMKATDNEAELHREYKLNVFGS